MKRFIAKKLFYNKKFNNDNCKCESKTKVKEKSNTDPKKYKTDPKKYKTETLYLKQYKELCNSIKNQNMVAPTEIE